MGAGTSGVAASRLALSLGGRVTLLDSSRQATVCQRVDGLAAAGAEVRLGPEAEAWAGSADLVVLSPGIAAGSALGRLAAALDCPAVSELAFGGQFCPWPKLAVTGTNGKTTTVEMLTHCLRGAGLRVEAAGNIGLPLSEVAIRRPSLDFLVVEVSSFQLENIGGFRPMAAALLNVTPDHLSRHGDMATYLDLKLALLRALPPEGAAVVRADLLHQPAVATALQDRRVQTFAADELTQADWYQSHGVVWRRRPSGDCQQILAADELLLRGRHNLENVMAVLALAEAAGVTVERLRPALRTFRTGAHRLETIAVQGGVTFIDDSKATNVDALVQALRQLGHPSQADIALIAGGVDKGCDLSEALPDLRRYVRKVFLLGSCRARLASSWGQAVPVEVCADMTQAVAGAAACVADGGAVLLSPACASQDMFADYAHRGECFAEAVRGVLSEGGGSSDTPSQRRHCAPAI
ncbi:MAG: UDP-N-acetylmuramoyl-L-alanine--D-glutamate ligase [Lentisphaeria bacterium]|nr:UDP-N-acetylmuramoyl-L-alanine--D-glutamate ligase [Lentisphaeria bacterium]